jgi:hypothetical protein
MWNGYYRDRHSIKHKRLKGPHYAALKITWKVVEVVNDERQTR